MYFTTSLGLMRLIRNSKFCIKWVSYNNRKNVFIANQLGQILITNKKKIPTNLIKFQARFGTHLERGRVMYKVQIPPPI